VVLVRGVARILHWGAQKLSVEGAKNRGAEGSGDWAGVVLLPNRLEGLGSVVSSPSRVRSEALAANAFWHI